MKITSIINKNTKDNVCPQYINKKLDLNKSVILIGKPLMIVYKNGSYFNHENVISIERLEDGVIKIETTNKFWIISK